jgi:hypothetical protein
VYSIIEAHGHHHHARVCESKNGSSTHVVCRIVRSLTPTLHYHWYYELQPVDSYLGNTIF